jgi:hypothetical protein
MLNSIDNTIWHGDEGYEATSDYIKTVLTKYDGAPNHLQQSYL